MPTGVYDALDRPYSQLGWPAHRGERVEPDHGAAAHPSHCHELLLDRLFLGAACLAADVVAGRGTAAQRLASLSDVDAGQQSTRRGSRQTVARLAQAVHV